MNPDLQSSAVTTPPRSKKRLVWIVLSFAFCLLGVGIFFGWSILFGSKPVATKPPVPTTPTGRDSIPVPKVLFTDATNASGLKFKHFNGASGKKLLPETMGGGVCVFDYDGDGLQDILFVNGCPWPGHKGPDKPMASCLTLYRNKGDGTFEDVTDAAGLTISMYGMGACAGDIDNDGFPDLFVTGIGGCKLFRNVKGGDGKRKFVDATQAAGIFCQCKWPGHLSSDEFYKSN